ncbi:DNA (cytosine-5)-methyltransferase PliMCI-like [Neocloeon triangulifer]|uniref:DNA (cytosine-5)-methyltransferase PliMCI-like n=1 Tax=Neocloeon triangulifer TaxID=2078957 RepID=UPI00286EEF6F|nr:DNA (cytosine-5)-methyltransferase PliMCI-like [Neocloeon triangulifer]
MAGEDRRFRECSSEEALAVTTLSSVFPQEILHPFPDDDDNDDDEPLPYFSSANVKLFDGNGRACGIEEVEQGVIVRMSGVLREYNATTTSATDGFPLEQSGEIIEWFIHGLDSSETFLCVQTQHGNYKILSFDKETEPSVKKTLDKIFWTNHFLRSLIDKSGETLEEIVNNFHPTGPMAHLVTMPTLEDFKENAPFIFRHVERYALDKNEDGSDDYYLLERSSFQEFCVLAEIELKPKGKKEAPMGTKLTNTPLVREVFSMAFEYMKDFKDMPEEQEEVFDKVSNENRDCSLKFQGIVSFIHETPLRVEERMLKAPYVGLIIYQDEDVYHVQVLMRSSESYLKGFAQKNEYFGTNVCLDVHESQIWGQPQIQHKSDCDENSSTNGTSFYQMRLDDKSGAFTSLGPTIGNSCDLCEKKEKTRYEQLVQMDENNFSFEYRGNSYCIGSFAFTTRLVPPIPDPLPALKHCYDPIVCPEWYRVAKSQTLETKHYVLGVCQILEISAGTAATSDAKDVRLKVRVYRRPSDTRLPFRDQTCPHELYHTDEVQEISASEIIGPAYVAYEKRLTTERHKWIQAGDNRFCFSQKYSLGSNKLSDVPHEARNCIGHMDPKTKNPVEPPIHKVPAEKLKTMDLFAGCGGLSLGLHEAGLCESKWAVECDEHAAQAYSKNFKDATVYVDDVNLVLANMMEEKNQNNKGQAYAKKGEVGMVIGGPPCQGFSVMNRYPQGEAALFKNSSVSTFCSAIDILKPKFFIFENVKNFAFAHKGSYLKTVIACCLRMGYQVRFGILQAGAYGVPQARQRIIILGALPGNKLPDLPKITHVFNQRSQSLVLDGQLIDDGTAIIGQNCRDAPIRTINVFDAISDLPDIESKGKESSNDKYSLCKTIFQEQAREHSKQLTEHTVKRLSPLNALRVRLIASGDDWRSWPNIQTCLPDRSKVERLKYLKGENSTKVCTCQLKPNNRKKNPACGKCKKHKKTIILRFLPLSADRHAQWPGVFGRPNIFGPFKTTVTSPVPSGMQGTVVHPTYHRCFSVREHARSQGFPDHFEFSGALEDKYCQIGNAVPPPLAKRIGMCFP